MDKFKTLCSNLFLSLLAVSFIFILLEISAQIYINNFAGEQNFKKYASLKQIQSRESVIKYTPHPYLRYYPTPNYRQAKNRHNSLGYRGDEIEIPKPEGQFRIVCIGGSTTYATDLDDYKMAYPSLLENNLIEAGYENIKVINAGVGGWTSWESMINFELRILDLDPDVIIINHAINDIHARLVWPPEAYKGDNSALNPATGYIIMPSIFEYSSLIRIFMIKTGLTTSHAALEKYGKPSDKSKNTAYISEFKKQKRTNTYPTSIFQEISAMKMLETNKPIFFKRNIRNIVLIAKTEGIKTVLVSFAYSPLFDDSMVSSDEYNYAYNEMNAVLKDIANELNVSFFDLKKEFPEDKMYYKDGRHVTIEGAQLKVKLFADFLIKNKLVPLH